MITPISINRQNINFQARAKMDKQSKKVGQYFEDHNIDVNKVLIGSGVSAAGAAGVLLGSPDMVSAPDAAKYGIILPMVSTAGAMGVNHVKGQQAKKQKEQAEAEVKGETVVQEKSVKEPVIQKTKTEVKELTEGERLAQAQNYIDGAKQRHFKDYWYVTNTLDEDVNEKLDVNKRSDDPEGYSILTAAINDGRTDIVKKLLTRKDLDLSSTDKYGRTDLIHMLFKTEEWGSNTKEFYTSALIEVLENRDDVGINKRIEGGPSLLDMAMSGKMPWKIDIINAISKRKDLDVKSTDKGGYTNLMRLCAGGYAVAVKNILELHDDIDLNQRGLKDNLTCMDLAKAAKNDEIVRLLYEYQDRNTPVAKERCYKVNSDTGILKLTKQGVKDYNSVVEETDYYKEYHPRTNYWYTNFAGDASKKLQEYKKEVLRSLGEFSTKYSDTVVSADFGKIKLTDKGLKQYMDILSEYAPIKVASKNHQNSDSLIADRDKLNQKIEILRGCGEIPE
ncbi:hypothetical protein IJI31_06360 [bacterium]|nr:hypothetical protein [bacterium]